MKQTSFKVKNLEENFPEKQSTIIKRSFRFSTKHLSLNSTIPVDELTADCTDPNTWLTNDVQFPIHD